MVNSTNSNWYQYESPRRRSKHYYGKSLHICFSFLANVLFIVISCLFSAIFGIVGVIVYGVNMNDQGWEMAWSFLVVIVGCALVFIGFLVLVVALVTKRPESLKESFYPTTLYVDPDKNVLYTISVEDN